MADPAVSPADAQNQPQNAATPQNSNGVFGGNFNPFEAIATQSENSPENQETPETPQPSTGENPDPFLEKPAAPDHDFSKKSFAEFIGIDPASPADEQIPPAPTDEPPEQNSSETPENFQPSENSSDPEKNLEKNPDDAANSVDGTAAPTTAENPAEPNPENFQSAENSDPDKNFATETSSPENSVETAPENFQATETPENWEKPENSTPDSSDEFANPFEKMPAPTPDENLTPDENSNLENSEISPEKIEQNSENSETPQKVSSENSPEKINETLDEKVEENPDEISPDTPDQNVNENSDETRDAAPENPTPPLKSSDLPDSSETPDENVDENSDETSEPVPDESRETAPTDEQLRAAILELIEKTKSTHALEQSLQKTESLRIVASDNDSEFVDYEFTTFDGGAPRLLITKNHLDRRDQNHSTHALQRRADADEISILLDDEPIFRSSQTPDDATIRTVHEKISKFSTLLDDKQSTLESQAQELAAQQQKSKKLQKIFRNF